MNNKQSIFKTKTVHMSTQWNPSFYLDYAQCPVCERWFNYFTNNDFRGLKLHIRKWATKEATAKALKEISKMPHFDYWKQHSEVVSAVPKNREWTI